MMKAEIREKSHKKGEMWHAKTRDFSGNRGTKLRRVMRPFSLICLFLQFSVFGCTGFSITSARNYLIRGLDVQIPKVTVTPEAETQMTELSTSPQVFFLSDFLSSIECDQLIDLHCDSGSQTSEPPLLSVSPKRLAPLAPILLLSASATTLLQEGRSDFGINLALQAFFAAAVLAAGAALLRNPWVRESVGLGRRSSQVTPLGLENGTSVTAGIIRKACELLKCSPDRLERPALTHYEAGQEFGSHQDASSDLVKDGWDQIGGQRTSTLLMYLNEIPPNCGGCTVFDTLGIRVRPQRGAALLFFPASDVSNDERGAQVDRRMLHRAEPPAPGVEKYVIQIWQRERRVPPPLGLTDKEIALL